MSMVRGMIAGALAVLLSGCMTTRSLECVQDASTGTMKCTEIIDVIRD